MKITIESTDKIVTLVSGDTSEVQARLWEGHTDSGIPVHCYIVRIAVDLQHDQKQFEAELRETRTPSAELQAIPLRLIL